jgi:hypothetical protein
MANNRGINVSNHNACHWLQMNISSDFSGIQWNDIIFQLERIKGYVIPNRKSTLFVRLAFLMVSDHDWERFRWHVWAWSSLIRLLNFEIPIPCQFRSSDVSVSGESTMFRIGQTRKYQRTQWWDERGTSVHIIATLLLFESPPKFLTADPRANILLPCKGNRKVQSDK